VHGLAAHALKTHPGVDLDVLHDVTDVQGPIGERERGGNEQLAWHAPSLLEKIASDFFDTAPLFAAAKSVVFAACARA
jgi:hypothetical protein